MVRVKMLVERGWATILLAPPADDRDWRAYVAEIDAMNRAVPRGVRPVLLQQIQPGVPPPSALVRKELAELRKRIRSDALNVVVLPSTLPRVAQVALDWLHVPHYESHTVSDLETALALIEARVEGAGELRAMALELRRLA